VAHNGDNKREIIDGPSRSLQRNGDLIPVLLRRCQIDDFNIVHLVVLSLQIAVPHRNPTVERKV
jgi:hypothetical protein